MLGGEGSRRLDLQAAEDGRAEWGRGAGGYTDGGGIPAAAVSLGAGTKGLLAGRPAPFSCLLGLDAGNVARYPADQQSGALGAWGGLGPACPALCGALAGGGAGVQGGRPFVWAFRGTSPARRPPNTS